MAGLVVKFVSTNVKFIQQGKAREIREIFKNEIENGNIILEIINLAVSELQGTPDEIIRDKIERASRAVDGILLIEDTSLFFEAWNSLPGPYM
jgi:inosine/xanthosine triphosphate pyrophosphatase family protein